MGRKKRPENIGETYKWCYKCKCVLPRSEFNKDKSRSDGLRNKCRECERITVKAWREANRERVAATSKAWYIANRMRVLAIKQAYEQRADGVANKLRANRGYSYEDSIMLAPLLLDDNQHCAICGIPNWLIKLNYKTRAFAFFGKPENHSRLHPDRVDTSKPHMLANTRLLCPNCNYCRGAEMFTDEQVLQQVRYKWLQIFSPKKLWWLHTTPGQGGRANRSETCKQRDARYAADSSSAKLEPSDIDLTATATTSSSLTNVRSAKTRSSKRSITSSKHSMKHTKRRMKKS